MFKTSNSKELGFKGCISVWDSYLYILAILTTSNPFSVLLSNVNVEPSATCYRIASTLTSSLPGRTNLNELAAYT